MNQHTEPLLSMLQRRGVLSAREMAQGLGVSQPTLSRAVSGVSRQRLLRIGQGKSARYAARRAVKGDYTAWPLYHILPEAEIQLIGYLHALEPREWYLEQQVPWESLRAGEFRDGLYPGLPWFLQDMRPQGFLGRVFARRYGLEIGASADPRVWSGEDIITALTRFGGDMPGSFLVGDEMAAVYQRQRHEGLSRIARADRAGAYPVRADDIMHDGLPGSSAAGEQPKFTAQLGDAQDETRHVLVKFSGNAGRPEDQRWADLLVAEHVANSVLRSHGIPCAETMILQSEGRTFLESERFDREGSHGRRGLTSLEAIDSAFFGQMDTPWTAAADRLRADGWISEQDAHHLCVLWWFGAYIGNTDMHYGNVSLYLPPSLPLKLAPTYDMVPMQYRPNQEGGLPDTTLELPPPSPADRMACAQAASAALEYWLMLGEEPLLSDPFRSIAARNSEALKDYRRQYRS